MSRWTTQREIVRLLRRVIERRGDGTIPEDQLHYYLGRMYNEPNRVKNINFWCQDENGIPTEVVQHNISGEIITPIHLWQYIFDPDDWKNETKPINYRGPWPPQNEGDLISTPAAKEHCLVCSERTFVGCQCTHAAFQEYEWDFFIKRLRIGITPDKGYGLFARHEIEPGEVMGEYLGELLPQDSSRSDEETTYFTQLFIGPHVRDKQAECRVNALYAGSFSRFINHSCEPNAIWDSGRIGHYRRGQTIVCSVPISAGQEITIDYGSTWFKEGEYCHCGTDKCKWPPPKPGGEDPKKSGSKKKGTKGKEAHRFTPY